MFRVAVVGAGIIGVSSALKIKEKYPEFEVVIISKDFTPLTTGDNSAGLWLPYIISQNQDELITKWGMETYRFLHQLWRRGGLNISFLPVYCLKRQLDDKPAPQWSRHVFGFNQFGSKQLKYFSDLYSASPEFVQGYYFSTFVTPPQVVLPYLMKLFQEAGGKIVEGTVTSLKDDVLSPFDVVVNCTGVKAREIVPDDRVFSVRGQVLKVEAPWVSQCVLDLDGDNYILPNFQTCVLGGTHQENDYSTQLNDKDTEFILKGCRRILPGLENAKIVSNWAGLRPARDETRTEAEQANGKLYIHNYGHGGSGLTLFWGCATDVVQLLQRNLGVKSHI